MHYDHVVNVPQKNLLQMRLFSFCNAFTTQLQRIRNVEKGLQPELSASGCNFGHYLALYL